MKAITDMMRTIKYILLLAFMLPWSNVYAQKLYNTTWTQAGSILGSSAALMGGSLILENRRDPISVQDLNMLDRQNITGFDRNTSYNFSANASSLSDYLMTGLYIAPFTLMLSNQGRQNAKEIWIMYGELFSLNGSLTRIAKSGFGRYRPYAYNTDVPLELKLNEKTRKSFFSGHTSQATSLSFLTATIFDDLYPDSDWRYAVWAGAITAPAIMGYLRVKAGRHFPSDVIAGYGVGAILAYFIPKIHKITEDTNIDIFGVEGGLGLIYSF